jgi:hypothetical protein
MNPRNFVFSIDYYDGPATVGAVVVSRQSQTIWKTPFNQIPSHAIPPVFFANVQAAGRVVKRALFAHRLCSLFCGGYFPILVL